MTACPDLQVVVVEVEGRRCGLLARDVHEVVAAVRPSPLPGAPSEVEGLVNLRGTTVPVLDLRVRFGLPGRPVRPSDRMVVVEAAGRRLALRVDRVVDLASVAAADVDVEAHPLTGSGLTAGVARLPDGLLVICDLDAFLSADDVVALDLALAARDARGDA